MFNLFAKLNEKQKYAFYLVLIFTTIPKYIDTLDTKQKKQNSYKYGKEYRHCGNQYGK